MAETLEAALAALTALHPKKIDLGLDRIERVLEALGRPQDILPPTVHIAGTNGKGSTVSLLRAMAEAAGQTVHVYTSPHLVRFNERIVVASEQISDEALMDVIARVRAANGDEPLSFFEATTAAAFLAFSETPADACLLETGLGGRYDATNVVDHPVAVGITPIDYDHAEFLGRDIAGIAREKAGIFKPGAAIYVGPQKDQVRAVLEAEANKINQVPHFYAQEFRTYTERDRMIFEDERQLLDLPLPALTGDHQIVNAATAIALARHLDISPDAVAEGLENVSWPARIQNLTRGPLAEMVTEAGGELWLDGGHNPHAGRALAAAMANMETRYPRPLVLVAGMLSNKDVAGFLEPFSGLAGDIIALDIPGHAALAPEILIELAAARGLRGQIAASPEEAIRKAIAAGNKQRKDDRDRPPRILICGSLYLAGHILADNG